MFRCASLNSAALAALVAILCDDCPRICKVATQAHGTALPWISYSRDINPNLFLPANKVCHPQHQSSSNTFRESKAAPTSQSYLLIVEFDWTWVFVLLPLASANQTLVSQSNTVVFELFEFIFIRFMDGKSSLPLYCKYSRYRRRNLAVFLYEDSGTASSLRRLGGTESGESPRHGEAALWEYWCSRVQGFRSFAAAINPLYHVITLRSYALS